LKNLIADFLLTVASLGFVIADLKQGLKLFTNKRYNISAFSYTHFKVKMISLSLVIIAYFMLGCFMALTVAVLQLLINIYISDRIGLLHLKKYEVYLIKKSKRVIKYVR
jgi:hypothetical protein